MSDSITPNTPLELSIDEWIERIGPASTAPEIDLTLRTIAKTDHLTRAKALKSISEITKLTVTDLKKQIKPYIDAAKAEESQEIRKLNIDVTDKTYNEMAELLVIPANGNDQPERMNAYMIVETRSEHYLTPFWSSQNHAAPAICRELRERTIENSRIAGFDPLLDGNPDKVLENSMDSLRKILETDVQKGRIGITCKASFGPILRNGKFHTKSDIKNGILIARGWGLSGAEVVRKSQQPEERPEAFDLFKRICGSNWQTNAAHVLASILNESKSGKHGLFIWGSSGSGKSFIARSLATLIDGSPTILSGNGIEGNWPKYFSCRSPIIGNLDNGSMDVKNLDIISESITEGVMTVPQRYTPAGLTAEAGYPIFTTTQSDIFARDAGLSRRLIVINQNENEEIMTLVTPEKKGMKIIADVRPHFWWLVELMAQAIIDNLIPDVPGGLMQSDFARARWWIAIVLEGLTPQEAEEICKGYRIENDADATGNQFTTILITALLAESRTKVFPAILTCKQLHTIMCKHCELDMENMDCGKKGNFKSHPQAPNSVSRFIQKNRIGNRIGEWRLDDCKSEKGDRAYKISRIGDPDALPF